MIQAAVIGCGRMGAFTSESVRRYSPAAWLPLSHCEAIVAHPKLQLAGLCDPHAETLARAQAEYGVAQGFSGHRELIDAVHPTLVGIATRTVGRAEIIADCVAAGARALHIEKPLCNSVAELAALEALADEHGLFMTYGAIRRFLPVFRQAKAIAESGELGDLLEMRFSMGARTLYWTHPHTMDLALYLAGDRQLVSVNARLGDVERTGAATIGNDPVIDAAQLWFDDGVACHVGRAPGNELELAFTRGRISIKADGRVLVVAGYRNDDPYLHEEDVAIADPDGPTGTLAPVTQLVACLDGDTDAIAANRVVRDDIFAGQRILFALVQSHLNGGGDVRPDAIDPALTILAATDGRFA